MKKYGELSLFLHSPFPSDTSRDYVPRRDSLSQVTEGKVEERTTHSTGEDLSAFLLPLLQRHHAHFAAFSSCTVLSKTSTVFDLLRYTVATPPPC